MSSSKLITGSDVFIIDCSTEQIANLLNYVQRDFYWFLWYSINIQATLEYCSTSSNWICKYFTLNMVLFQRGEVRKMKSSIPPTLETDKFIWPPEFNKYEVK